MSYATLTSLPDWSHTGFITNAAKKKLRKRMAEPIKEMVDLGRVVRYHRKRAGLSRAALSDLAGTGTTVIYELEHGKPTVQFDIVQRILRTLNLTLLVDGPLLDEYVRRTDEKS